MARRTSSKEPLDVALQFLSYRPRSEAEVRRRLIKDFPTSLVEATVVQLKAKGLLDDAAFARFWRDNREQHRPRSKAIIRQELFQKGINRNVADEALEGLDEEASAIRAGRKLLRRLRGVDSESFRSKMGSHLGRRGFSYGVAVRATEALWQELSDPVDGNVDGNA